MQVTASLRWDIPFVKGLWAKALVAYDPKFYKSKEFKNNIGLINMTKLMVLILLQIHQPCPA